MCLSVLFLLMLLFLSLLSVSLCLSLSLSVFLFLSLPAFLFIFLSHCFPLSFSQPINTIVVIPLACFISAIRRSHHAVRPDMPEKDRLRTGKGPVVLPAEMATEF